MIKKLRITVENKTYEVDVEVLESSPAAAPAPLTSTADPTPVTASSSPASPAARNVPAAAIFKSSSGNDGDVPSPLAGRVVAVEVKVGDTVEAGAQLLTLEAMKMNTFVFSPRAGTVVAVHVQPGDAVEEAQPLITLN